MKSEFDEKWFENEYKERALELYSRKLKKSIKRKIGGTLLNYFPFVGFLPYSVQESIQRKYESFKPRVATLASAVELGIISYFFNAAVTNDFVVGIPWRAYSDFIYEHGEYIIVYKPIFIELFKIPKYVIALLSNYLIFDSIIRTIASLATKRPWGTIIVDGIYHPFKYVSKKIMRLTLTKSYKEIEDSVRKELAVEFEVKKVKKS
jgi:hypothetical protein